MSWAFGVAGPLVCVALDPIVFRGSRSGPFEEGPWFAPLALAAYLVIAVCVATMASALLTGAIGPVRRGILLGGSVFSTLVALFVSPLALLVGPLVLLSLREHGTGPELAKLLLFPLGLIPIGTALVFWLAFARTPAGSDRGSVARRRLIASGAALLVLAAPTGLQVLAAHAASRAQERIVSAPQAARESDIRVLRVLAFTTDFGPLVSAYAASGLEQDRAVFSDIYSKATGRNIEIAARRLAD